MNYHLLISEAAISDIIDSINWYEKQQVGLGQEFYFHLDDALQDIVNAPLHCQKRYKDIRIKFLRRFPFGIHYEIESSDIMVHAVFHMRRSPKRWSARLEEDDDEA